MTCTIVHLRPGHRFSVVRAVGAYAFLLVSWLLSNPPFSAPDEWAHYLRAIGLTEGSWIGRKVAHYDPDPGTTAEQMDFLRQTVRAVRVPPGMSPRGYACHAYHPDQSAQCNDAVIPLPAPSELVTVVGVYPPLFYILPATFMRVGSTPLTALRVARGAQALTCLFLLLLALLCAHDPSRGNSSFLGIALATTPMVLYFGASFTPSGPEIFAAIAFWVSLLRLLRDDESPPRWVFLVIASSGASLALARSLGVAWVLLYVLAFVFVAGVSRLYSLWRRDRGPLLAVAITLVIACAGNRLWEAAYGARVGVTLAVSVIEEMIRSRTLLTEWVKESVGVFQYLDTPMPSFAYRLYALAFVGLTLGALWHAKSRERLLFAVGIVGAAIVPLALYCSVVRPTGFRLQGRYILPFIVLSPLLAGELLRRHWSGRRWAVRYAMLGPVALASFLHFEGLYVNGRRSAVGLSGPSFFLRQPEWNPPGGWALCLGLAVIGCVLLVSALTMADHAEVGPVDRARQ